jgi:opacity protein-like surface antigen
MNLRHALLPLAGLAMFPVPALADSGFYVGAAAGGATQEIEFGGPPEIEEDDTGFKVFGGYKFDMSVVDLGVELGYVDFGEVEIDTAAGELVFDTTGINLWGVAGFELGPVDLFAKLGVVVWDVETTTFAGKSSDDGTDFGFGVGAGFDIGKVQIRGEYELYDTSGSEVSMLSMLSLGVIYPFN